MSKGDNSPGVSRLASVLRGIADKQIPKELLLDFGVIRGDKSLLTNTYPLPIPRSDYLVCRHLKSRTVKATTSSRSVGDHGSHSHTVDVSTREALKVGDRVLVAWVQNDAVVVDVILSASSVI